MATTKGFAQLACLRQALTIPALLIALVLGCFSLFLLSK
jgi:hypothetical protein